MERIILGILIGISFAATFGLLGSHDYAEDCDIALETQRQFYLQMLRDTHQLYSYVPTPVQCIDTGLDVHSYLSSLASYLERNDHPVVINISGE